MRLRTRISNLDRATAKLVGINAWDRANDPTNAMSDGLLRAFVGEHWAQHCSTTELLAIAGGRVTEAGLMRLKWKYRNGPASEARRRTG
jgi:hypothetical protein